MVPICYENGTAEHGSMSRVENLFGMYSGGPEFIPGEGMCTFMCFPY